MTDWLGMAADPRAPPPELKARVLARALAGPRRRWWLAAAAVLVLAVGGAYWSYRTVTTLRAERDRLAGVVASLRDSLALVNSASAKVVWIPVTTGGRVGGVTIFADSLRHRWLVRCDGLTRNAPDQAYQIWFVTEEGMKSAALMAMDHERPMVMALDMPPNGGKVMGAAMTIEPRAGSTEPHGPFVFHRSL
ncbi:MAG TPA: anti-sigma factor [Gemmatimonadales bacterium]|nr:anti-sigma factor [Gemmatimonadales bacterium]